MTDHAKCRVCGQYPVECSDDDAPVPECWIECPGNDEFMCVVGPKAYSMERAWAAWDELMRYMGMMGAIDALDKAIDAFPPELLAACLKETDDDD